MSPGTINLSVSTVIPCKRPVSQLFRNFDLTRGSSVGRFLSHCNRAVAMENQHTLREDTAAKRNACPLDFAEPKKNKHAETLRFAWNFSFAQMSCKSFLKFQVGIISLHECIIS